jgi:hypothetical protein
MIDPYYTGLADQASGPAILASLHYAYPTTVFIYYLVSSMVAVCTLQTRSSDQSHGRQSIIKWFFLLSVLTYLVQLLALMAQGVAHDRFPLEQDLTIGLLSCILVFGVEFAGLADSPNPVWYPFVGSLGIALVIEPIIEGLSAISRPSGPLGFIEFFDISIVGVRYLAFISALVLYCEGAWNAKKEKGTDAERQSLLKSVENGEVADGHKDPTDQAGEVPQQDGYGTASEASDEDESADTTKTSSTERVESPWERREREAREQMEKRLKEKGNWFTYARSFMVC